MSEFSLEALAGDEGKGAEHVPSRLLQALRLYLRDCGSGRPGSDYPAFRGDGELSDSRRSASIGGVGMRKLRMKLGGIEDEVGLNLGTK